MIVDDHAGMRRVLRNYISLSGNELEFVECESGEKAIADYMDHKPDWVLTDIELKSMSGFDVIEEIQAQDPSANLIIVTSYHTPTFRRKAKRLNIRGFVCKDDLNDLNQLLLNTTY